MDFRLLGPLEVLDGGVPLGIAARKQRALLAILLLNANRTVGRDRLVDELWGDEPPGSAQKMVQIYVSRLRRLLPGGRLQTRPGGYALEVDERELDLARFEQLVGEARRALEAGDPSAAAGLARSALELWRGPALAEFAEPFARSEGARLEEAHAAATELRIEADLDLGRHADVVGELEGLIGRFPLRERLRSLHMLALYRSGRQAEALSSYQAFRRTLDEELGIEPTGSLRELERQILQQDPGLDHATTPRRVPRVRRPRDVAPPALADAAADIRYARSDDVRIAYQVVGAGPLDLVLVHGWVCTFQPGWESPRLAGFYRRLASMGRLILFDKRGTGLSDRVSPHDLADLETRMDDVRAVMDAAGSERAVVLGISEGGPMSVLFAATYPQRTVALVLMGTFARMLRAPDYPIGIAEEDYEARIVATEHDDWASATTNEWLARVGPDILHDAAARRWYTSYIVRGASPAAARTIRLMNREIDVRQILPTIGVPTLVLYRAGEHFREGTRFMAERIPGARAVELPGIDHLPWEGDRDALLEEIERFLAGVHDDGHADRVLATLLRVETDGAQAGGGSLADDRRLEQAQITRFRGQLAGPDGDGLLATFDGPARAIRCAIAIVEAAGGAGLSVRAGLHTGEIEQRDGPPRGIAVRIAAAVAALARPGEVLVSGTVKDIVAGSGIAFADRGEHELPGVPGPWRVYAVAGAGPDSR